MTKYLLFITGFFSLGTIVASYCFNNTKKRKIIIVENKQLKYEIKQLKSENKQLKSENKQLIGNNENLARIMKNCVNDNVFKKNNVKNNSMKKNKQISQLSEFEKSFIAEKDNYKDNILEDLNYNMIIKNYYLKL